MEELRRRTCEACHVGASRISDEEVAKYRPAIPDWDIVDADSVKRLMRRFRFSNFEEALSFTVKVGEIAEQEGHHPSILTEWGRVTVSWWSHSIKGLHINDFIMAARTDALYQG